MNRTRGICRLEKDRGLWGPKVAQVVEVGIPSLSVLEGERKVGGSAAQGRPEAAWVVSLVLDEALKALQPVCTASATHEGVVGALQGPDLGLVNFQLRQTADLMIR